MNAIGCDVTEEELKLMSTWVVSETERQQAIFGDPGQTLRDFKNLISEIRRLQAENAHLEKCLDSCYRELCIGPYDNLGAPDEDSPIGTSAPNAPETVEDSVNGSEEVKR